MSHAEAHCHQGRHPIGPRHRRCAVSVGTPDLLLLYLFGFARSLIGLRHPSPVDLTRMYSSFGIDYIDVSIAGSSSTPLSSTMRIFSKQWGCCCAATSGHSTAARVFASSLHLHCRPLCIDDCAAKSLLRHMSAQGLRPADWSSSSSCHYSHRR
jgi:hypothetical protein